MNPLVEKIISGIKKGNLSSFILAADVARVYIQNAKDDPDSRGILEADLQPGDLDQIRCALKEYITENIPGKISQAIHALSNFYHNEDKDFLISILEKQLVACMGYNSTLGQIVIGIDNIDENIITGGEYSINDPTKFITEAQQYLYKLGRTVPW